MAISLSVQRIVAVFKWLQAPVVKVARTLVVVIRAVRSKGANEARTRQGVSQLTRSERPLLFEADT